MLTETTTYDTPTYGQLPYSRVLLSGDYTLPPYTQDVWDRTRSAPSVSYVVVLQNDAPGQVTVSPGTNWVGGAFQVSGGCCSLMLVLDNGQSATMCPVGSAASIAGSFTVSTTGPITATSPVVLGGNLALNNTALNSIPNSSWKAGNSSTVGIGGFNIAVGELSIAAVNSVALGYQGAASINSVGIGYQANATGTGEVAIGYQAVAQQDDTIAIGRESSAIGTNTVVIGRGGLANAANATGMGTGVQAIGTNSAAFGNAAGSNNSGTALGNQSFSGIEGVAVGSTSLSGNQGVAVGYNSQNNFPNGVAVGRQTRTDQDGVAVGYNATASTSGTSLGSGSVANALNAAAIGKGVSNAQSWSTLIGYSDPGTSNIHQVTSSGIFKSTYQVACSMESRGFSLTSGAPVDVGTWTTLFDYTYDPMSPPYVGPGATQLYLKTPNSVYLVGFWASAPNTVVSGFVGVKLRYYNSQTVTVTELLSGVGNNNTGSSQDFATGSIIVKTSNNTGDYIFLRALADLVLPATTCDGDFKIWGVRIA